MSAADEIRQFIDNELLEGVTPGVDPLALGMLDSLAIEQIAAFVEDELGVVLQDDDFVEANFCSIEALVALVESKSGTPTRP